MIACFTQVGRLFAGLNGFRRMTSKHMAPIRYVPDTQFKVLMSNEIVDPMFNLLHIPFKIRQIPFKIRIERKQNTPMQ